MVPSFKEEEFRQSLCKNVNVKANTHTERGTHTPTPGMKAHCLESDCDARAQMNASPRTFDPIKCQNHGISLCQAWT